MFSRIQNLQIHNFFVHKNVLFFVKINSFSNIFDLNILPCFGGKKNVDSLNQNLWKHVMNMLFAIKFILSKYYLPHCLVMFGCCPLGHKHIVGLLPSGTWLVGHMHWLGLLISGIILSGQIHFSELLESRTKSPGQTHSPGLFELGTWLPGQPKTKSMLYHYLLPTMVREF